LTFKSFSAKSIIYIDMKSLIKMNNSINLKLIIPPAFFISAIALIFCVGSAFQKNAQDEQEAERSSTFNQCVQDGIEKSREKAKSDALLISKQDPESSDSQTNTAKNSVIPPNLIEIHQICDTDIREREASPVNAFLGK
jgi:hypothetical protein